MNALKRFSLSLLALFAFTFVACQTEPETTDGVTDTDIVADDIGPMDDTFDEGIFTTYDADTDTYLTEEEFRTGYAGAGLYDTYDTDMDTYLTEEEFRTGYMGAGFDSTADFMAYDADGDGRVSRDELAAGLFRALDTNQDDRLDRTEFQRFDQMMGTGMGMGTGTGMDTDMNGTGMDDTGM